MRKIEKLALAAWNAEKAFRLDNTQIQVNREHVFYLLHGHPIAVKKLGATTFEISACGWLTDTTKSRLNSLPGVSISQKDFRWYLNSQPWNGETIEIEASK